MIAIPCKQGKLFGGENDSVGKLVFAITHIDEHLGDLGICNENTTIHARGGSISRQKMRLTDNGDITYWFDTPHERLVIDEKLDMLKDLTVLEANSGCWGAVKQENIRDGRLRIIKLSSRCYYPFDWEPGQDIT